MRIFFDADIKEYKCKGVFENENGERIIFNFGPCCYATIKPTYSIESKKDLKEIAHWMMVNYGDIKEYNAYYRSSSLDSIED